MTLIVPDKGMEQNTGHAESAYADECCGLLIGAIPPDYCEGGSESIIDEARALGNSWENGRKTNRYQIDPLAFARVELELEGTSRGVIGVYHSHPDVAAWPSPFDLEQAWPCFAYLIVSVKNGTAVDRRVWGLSEDRRSFEEGSVQAALVGQLNI